MPIDEAAIQLILQHFDLAAFNLGFVLVMLPGIVGIGFSLVLRMISDNWK